MLSTPVVAATFMAVVATLSVLLKSRNKKIKGFALISKLLFSLLPYFHVKIFSVSLFMPTLCQVLLFRPVFHRPSNLQRCGAGTW